jgi:hypothetical protein
VNLYIKLSFCKVTAESAEDVADSTSLTYGRGLIVTSIGSVSFSLAIDAGFRRRFANVCGLYKSES